MERLRLSLYSVLAALLAVPLSTSAMSFREIVNGPIVSIGNSAVKLLYAIAFIVFLYGMLKFFFTQSEEARQKGRQFMLWGIIILVALFTIWGVVKILLGVLTAWA